MFGFSAKEKLNKHLNKLFNKVYYFSKQYPDIYKAHSINPTELKNNLNHVIAHHNKTANLYKTHKYKLHNGDRVEMKMRLNKRKQEINHLKYKISPQGIQQEKARREAEAKARREAEAAEARREAELQAALRKYKLRLKALRSPM